MNQTESATATAGFGKQLWRKQRQKLSCFVSLKIFHVPVMRGNTSVTFMWAAQCTRTAGEVLYRLISVVTTVSVHSQSLKKAFFPPKNITKILSVSSIYL